MYIYDYCTKRGFRKTARELCSEAALDAESRPPIDAKQGLLYEYVGPPVVVVAVVVRFSLIG